VSYLFKSRKIVNNNLKHIFNFMDQLKTKFRIVMYELWTPVKQQQLHIYMEQYLHPCVAVQYATVCQALKINAPYLLALGVMLSVSGPAVGKIRPKFFNSHSSLIFF
jgi:hypothetical protein